MGFLVGFAMTLCAMEVVESGVAAIFVCFAEVGWLYIVVAGAVGCSWARIDADRTPKPCRKPNQKLSII